MTTTLSIRMDEDLKADAEEFLVGHKGPGPPRVDKSLVAVGPGSSYGELRLFAYLIPVVPKGSVDIKE